MIRQRRDVVVLGSSRLHQCTRPRRWTGEERSGDRLEIVYGLQVPGGVDFITLGSLDHEFVLAVSLTSGLCLSLVPSVSKGVTVVGNSRLHFTLRSITTRQHWSHANTRKRCIALQFLLRLQDWYGAHSTAITARR
jgi:hypothetical protein